MFYHKKLHISILQLFFINAFMRNIHLLGHSYLLNLQVLIELVRILLEKVRVRISIFKILNETHLPVLEHLFWTDQQWKAQHNWIKCPQTKQQNPFHYAQQRDPMSVTEVHIQDIMVFSFKTLCTCLISNVKKGKPFLHEQLAFAALNWFWAVRRMATNFLHWN